METTKSHDAVRDARHVSAQVKKTLDALVGFYFERMRQGVDITEILRARTPRQVLHWQFLATGARKDWEKLDENGQAEYYQAAAECGPRRFIGVYAKCLFYVAWVLDKGENVAQDAGNRGTRP